MLVKITTTLLDPMYHPKVFAPPFAIKTCVFKKASLFISKRVQFEKNRVFDMKLSGMLNV